MKSRWGVVLVGVLVLGLWTASASGQHPAGMGGYGMSSGHGGFGMMLPLFVKGAGLTEAQQAQVKQIVANHRPQFRALLGQLRTAHERLAEKLYAAGAVKTEDLVPLMQEMSQLRGQLTQEGLQVTLEIRGVLTPEQLAKAGQTRRRFNELRAEMRDLLGGDQ